MSGASDLSSSASRSNSSSSNIGSIGRLNPTAMSFTPAARTSSKRKASSSAKSALSSPPDSPQAQVYIDADQLLGPEATSSFVRADSIEDLSDFEELEDAYAATRNPGLAMPLGMGGRLGRTRRVQQPSLVSRSIGKANAEKTAVILVQSQRPAQSSHSPASGPKQAVPYLPLFQHYSRSSKYNQYGILPSHINAIQCSASGGPRPTTTATWPKDRIPVELFEIITDYLARDDIKSMRLTCTEFERKVCQPLFRTAVVPFNTELYDFIADDNRAIDLDIPPRYKGKGKKKANSNDAALWTWRNAKEDKEGKVYLGHGLRVFQGFGPYIRRFGMSFDVSESQLSRPPLKQLLDPVEAYHGTYEWPSIHYSRFAKLNRLEETADDTSRMKAAFSHLTTVSELGLSMRNGLGWLEGPDKSFYASLVQQHPPIFGGTHGSKDYAVKSARDILSCLRQCIQKSAPGMTFQETTLDHSTIPVALGQIAGLQDTAFADPHLWKILDQNLFDPSQADPSISSPPSEHGCTALRANSELGGATKIMDGGLHPNELKREQKEWLLETEWAQRAFLESYILAIMDNPCVFSGVSTLNLATISSGLLPLVARDMFWKALPSVSAVIIHVSPDWRTVQKDEASYAETKLQPPSEAVRGFYELLRDHIATRDNITGLTLGYSDGGEQAQGLYARNTNVLPAPISCIDQSIAINPTNLLVFPHVEHLTLSNCWMTPTVLERTVKSHSETALRKLTLNSVSLTAHPNASTPAQQAQAAVAAMANMQAQLPNLNPAQPQVQQAMAQQFHAQMQQMQQLFNQPALAPAHPFAAPMPAFPMAPQAPVLPIPPALQANPQGGFMFPPAPPLQHFQQPPQPISPTYWANDHRQGSWPDLLNKISPGPIFADYLPQPQPWEDARPPRPSTNLRALELISCGYISLDHNNTFDQTALLTGPEAGATRERAMSPWFRARYMALKPFMLDGSSDKSLGSIVQWIPQRELDAMRFAWGLRVGWRDREKAEEAEFDGCRPGGTGRVSGVVSRGMGLMTQHLPGSSQAQSSFAQSSAQAGPSTTY